MTVVAVQLYPGTVSKIYSVQVYSKCVAYCTASVEYVCMYVYAYAYVCVCVCVCVCVYVDDAIIEGSPCCSVMA